MIKFVFGSNLAGRHGAGAAKVAREKFNAQNTVGRGPTGSSYAIPTKDWDLNTLHLSDIEEFISEFIQHVKYSYNDLFYLTPIGTGLAGYSHNDIVPFFKKEILPDNIIIPKVWEEFIPKKQGRILVYGGREWCYYKEGTDYLPKLDLKKFYQSCFIVEQLAKMMYRKENLVMITGCAKGADEIPIEMYKKFPKTYLRPLEFKPDWKNLGKKAGPIRNQQMIDEGQPTFAIGFPGGTGTSDMSKRLIKSKIPYFRMYDDNDFYETLKDLENLKIGV